MKNALLLAVGFFHLTVTAFGQKSYVYRPPADLNDGWEISSLRDLSIDTTGLYHVFNQLVSQEHKMHSILVAQNGRLVIEQYFGGHPSEQPHDLRSVTKSIRSLLVGIAVDQGIIASIDDPITKYLEDPVARQHLDPAKELITVRHLLNMASGLECNDWDKQSKGQEDKVHKKKDWLQYTVDLPMVADPGEVASYCSMGTVLLAEIVGQVSGMPIDQFAQQYLFDPLGITQVSWGHTSKKEVIPSAKRLYLTPRDMVKIGQLMLNKGQWDGKQVISSDWIDQTTRPQVQITGIDYGHLWWGFPFDVDGKMITSVTAMGNGGQYIMTFPDEDLVVAFTGGAYNSEEDKVPFIIVKNLILPMFLGVE